MSEPKTATMSIDCRPAPVQRVVRPRGETEVMIAAKLYQARDSMRKLCGPAFQDRISPYRALLMARASADHSKILHATMTELERWQKHGADGLSQALLLAAAVEIMEPSA